MDKRLFTLLVCACIIVSGFLLMLSSFDSLTNVVLSMCGLFVGVFGLFAIFGLGTIFSILAIADAVSRQQVVDGRYFTRCLIYRVAFLLCLLLYGFAFYRMVQTGDPDHGGDVLMIGFPGGIVLSLALTVTTSLHVISGLAALKKQKTISGGEFALHLFLQCCCGLDFIDTLILASLEMSNHPKERVGFLRHAIVKRTLPIPGFIAVLLGGCVLFALGMISSFISIGVHNFMLNFRTVFFNQTGRLSDASFFFFIFFFAVILCVILDAVRFYSKLPVDLTSRMFLGKVMIYSSIALVLEITFSSLLVMFAGSLITHYSLITSMSNMAVFKDYFLFITITVAAIVAVQVSASFYTRLCIKRSLTDGAISDEKAELFKRMSLFPGAQIVAVYRLIKANRDHVEAVEPG
jgi:hypothetical protein